MKLNVLDSRVNPIRNSAAGDVAGGYRRVFGPLADSPPAPAEGHRGMVAKIAFFPVGNGDMTLIELESGRKIIVDMNIRAAAVDPDDDTPDVATDLRSRLNRDSKGRLYVDVLLITHPDKRSLQRAQKALSHGTARRLV